MINLRPEIEKVLAKHEKDFMLDEEIAERLSDKDGVRLVQIEAGRQQSGRW